MELFYALNEANVIELRDVKIILDDPGKMVEFCRVASENSYIMGVKSWMDIYQHSRLLKFASVTYIRDELIKILLTPKPSIGITYLEDLLLLDQIFPELSKCKRTPQSRRSGVKNVFEHTMYALDAAENNLLIRLTVLMHDIGKPDTMQCTPDGKVHFFKHEHVGATIAKKRLSHLQFDPDLINSVKHLITHHMFDADPKITPIAVKRLVGRVGTEYIYDLLKVREADRQGTPNVISLRKIKVLRKKIDEEIGNV